jgi:hypothetical protein
MEAEVDKLNVYIDIIKYARDAAKGNFCQLRQRSPSLSQSKTVHSFSHPANTAFLAVASPLRVI